MHLLQDTGGQFNIKYGTGAVRGKVVTDVLRFSQPPIVVPDQGFGLATEHSADFASASCDGIFVSRTLYHAPATTLSTPLTANIHCRASALMTLARLLWQPYLFGFVWTPM